MSNEREHMPILLVEDDPLIALDAEDTLRAVGFDCLVAHDTKAAGAILEMREICAAILDYDLGSETSLCLARQVYSSRIPFAFVTGRNRSEILGRVPDPVMIHAKPADYAQVARQLAHHAGN